MVVRNGEVVNANDMGNITLINDDGQAADKFNISISDYMQMRREIDAALSLFADIETEAEKYDRFLSTFITTTAHNKGVAEVLVAVDDNDMPLKDLHGKEAHWENALSIFKQDKWDEQERTKKRIKELEER